MSENISTKELLKTTTRGEFVLHCLLPMGYAEGLPILTIRNDRLCMVIPYLKYKTTGVVDKTEVYPIRYTVTIELPSGRPVGFENLEVNPAFEGFDFTKPVGYFRHEAIKDLGKKEYRETREELYEMYDRIIAAILDDADYSEADEDEFVALLNRMIEPSVKEQYKVLDADFYEKYLDVE